MKRVTISPFDECFLEPEDYEMPAREPEFPDDDLFFHAAVGRGSSSKNRGRGLESNQSGDGDTRALVTAITFFMLLMGTIGLVIFVLFGTVGTDDVVDENISATIQPLAPSPPDVLVSAESPPVLRQPTMPTTIAVTVSTTVPKTTPTTMPSPPLTAPRQQPQRLHIYDSDDHPSNHSRNTLLYTNDSTNDSDDHPSHYSYNYMVST